jgi:GAF domain-containing protein
VDVLGSVHSLLLSGPRLEDLLVKLAGLAAKVVDPPASCGMTTRYDGQPRTIVTSDPRAALIDEQQYGLGEGPCLDALENGEVVDVADQASDYRWRRYRDSALELGVTASLSFPLIVDEQIIGALNHACRPSGSRRSSSSRQRCRTITMRRQAAAEVA